MNKKLIPHPVPTNKSKLTPDELLANHRVRAYVYGIEGAPTLSEVCEELHRDPDARKLQVFHQLLSETEFLRTEAGQRQLEGFEEKSLTEIQARVQSQTSKIPAPARKTVSFWSAITLKLEALAKKVHKDENWVAGLPTIFGLPLGAHSGAKRVHRLPRIDSGDFSIALTVGDGGEAYINFKGPSEIRGSTVVLKIGHLERRKRIPKSVTGDPVDVEFLLNEKECRALQPGHKLKLLLVSKEARK